MDNKKLVSTSQAAKILGISRIAVFNKIKKGEIREEKVGRNYVIRKDQLSIITGQELSEKEKNVIEKAVAGTVSEYGETLRLLGRE